MGAWSRLRVILHTENRQFPVFQAFHGLVVQVHMGHPQRSCPIDFVAGTPPNRKAVVLRRDLDRTVLQPPDRVIPRPMPIQELVGAPPEGPTQQLMAEADAEYRDLPLGKGADR